MAKKKISKIIRYRHPLNINVGMIIFAMIFVYLVFSVYTYMKKEKVQFYEIVEGNIVNDRQYTGIILRDERVESTDRAGYINYYIREGKRAAIGTRIYSIDETGNMAELMQENPDANVGLTDANLSDVKRQLSSFSMSYSDQKIENTYDLQYSLEAAVLEYANFNALGKLESLLLRAGASFVQVTAPVSGVVSFAVDGFENLTADEITERTFARSGYYKAITKAGQLIEQSAAVYKVMSSDNWSIVFPLTENEAEEN